MLEVYVNKLVGEIKRLVKNNCKKWGNRLKVGDMFTRVLIECLYALVWETKEALEGISWKNDWATGH